MLLGYSDSELANMGGYDLVHYDDLAYVASAHQERKFFLNKQKLTLINIIFFSLKNWSKWNDRLPLPNERRTMAMVANKFPISIQKFKT